MTKDDMEETESQENLGYGIWSQNLGQKWYFIGKKKIEKDIKD